MATNKTKQTEKSVVEFIKAVKDEGKRSDSTQIVKLMAKLTGLKAKMWGPSIIGFGSYHYQYASGHEGDMPIAAFSPRSTALVFYFCEDFENKQELLQRLGKHKTGKGCVYIKKLDDIDMAVLEKMNVNSIKSCKKIYSTQASS